MKNILKNRLFIFILGGIIFGSITGVVAYTINASNVEYKPSWTKENGDSINNVKEAVDELYNKASCNNISKNFTYTGTEQEFNIPKDGIYKLEVWGAQGGNYDSSHIGGYGGYSIGYVNLKKNTKLYINVGGQGNIGNGGYNGGGNSSPSWATGGGGASHIALSSGKLNQFINNYENVLIVAAGGGGVSWYTPNTCQYANGSHGGGTKGVIAFNDICNGRNQNSYSTKTSGGSQTTGGLPVSQNQCSGNTGSFGQGANASSCGFNSLGGGGGGFYGGASGSIGNGYNMMGATGGSGYISTKLSNAKMYCYDCEESNKNSDYTISTTGNSVYINTDSCPNGYKNSPVDSCAKTGNGYARISLKC